MEKIHLRTPRQPKKAVALVTPECVAWFNHRRILEPIGCIPAGEAEANYCRQIASQVTKVEA